MNGAHMLERARAFPAKKGINLSVQPRVGKLIQLSDEEMDYYVKRVRAPGHQQSAALIPKRRNHLRGEVGAFLQPWHQDGCEDCHPTGVSVRDCHQEYNTPRVYDGEDG